MFSSNCLNSEDLLDFQIFRDHKQISKRLSKTLYYGIYSGSDRLSLPLTDIAVELFSDASPSEVRKIDKQYAATVSRKACISPCAMMLAMVYIERLKHRNPEYLCNVSSSDLFLVSMMVASKYLYDDGEDDEVFSDEWADSASINIQTINQLEIKFLTAIDWNVFVSPSDFFLALKQLEVRVALHQGSWRGWYSYTDMQILCEQLKITDSWLFLKDNVLKVTIVCVITYVAGVITLVVAVVVAVNISQQTIVLHHHSSGTSPSDNFTIDHTLMSEKYFLTPHTELSCNSINVASKLKTVNILITYKDLTNNSQRLFNFVNHRSKNIKSVFRPKEPSTKKSNNVNKMHHTVIQ